MAVKLRLMRMGKTKQPTYRLVAADSRSPRNGRFIDLLGTYEPRAREENPGFKVDEEKLNRWLGNGAQPTERVQKLLEQNGVLTGEAAAKTLAAKKQAARPQKQKTVKEAPVAETAEEAPAAEEAAE